jgi:hypothetical protein
MPINGKTSILGAELITASSHVLKVRQGGKLVDYICHNPIRTFFALALFQYIHPEYEKIRFCCAG